MFAHTNSWSEYLKESKHIAGCPQTIADHHKDIAKQLDCKPPEHLQVNLGNIGGEPQHCYANCGKFMDERQRRYKKPLLFTLGWILWEFYGFAVIAEAHSVVTTPGGLLDCSPQLDDSKRILFCPHGSYHHWTDCLDFMEELNERNKNFPLCDAAVEWCDIGNAQYVSMHEGGITVRKDEENRKYEIYERWLASQEAVTA